MANPGPHIPRTTLVCIDCQNPRLALRALRLSLSQCKFPSVKFFSDAPAGGLALDAGIELVPIPRIASAEEYSRFVIKELLHRVATDFVQLVQWDGYVINGAAWTDEFLDYDYIGARWWFRPDGRNVGNGGFSLRSRRLLEALQDPQIEVGHPEDNVICLAYRDLLERRHGIRFAPPALADRYAFEGAPPSLREFGFHRLFNFPLLYGEAELAEILAQIPDADFPSDISLSLLQRLAELGRTSEAARYAERFRRLPEPYARLSAAVRAEFEEFLAALPR